jgi:quercetin dioxygenase-like cupin family protein
MKSNIKSFILVFALLMFSANLMGQESNGEKNEQAVVTKHTSEKLEWGPCPEFMPAGCNVAVLHGDPSKDNSDIFFRIKANSDIPNHWHNSAERMVLISGELEVTYKGEKTQVLKPGSYAYGPAMKPHSARCRDAGECVLFIAFEGPIDAFEGDR